MDKDNKKVNNANPQTSSEKSFDEIMDGFYDLSQMYSSAPKEAQKPKPKPKNREEELRLKDEERRESEWRAVKEDIERRYSLQYEDAKSNTEPSSNRTKRKPISGIITDVDEHETVKEELSRIDSLISSNAITEAAAQPEETSAEKPAKEKEDTAEYFDLSEKNSIYASIYSFGDVIYRFLARLFSFLFGLIKAPFGYLHKYIIRATKSTKKNTKRSINATVNEIVRFRKEIKNAGKAIKKGFKHPLSLPSIIIHFIKKAIHRHRYLLKSTVNILLPVAAFAIFLITINYWNGVTFALEVIYNEKSIGYISDESVFIEARDLVKDRLSSSAYVSSASGNEATIEPTVAASSNLNAHYTLSLVSLDELNDAQVISDKMIENSVDNLTHACGVYIDGEFICAVKNEADAKTVFYDIIAPYEADAAANGYVVGFAETIDYIQGLYRDDESVMWDASKLKGMLDGTKEAQKIYTVLEDDSLESIAEDTGVNTEQLKSLNPDYDWDEIQPGDTVVIKSSVKFVRIKKIVTTSEIRDTDYKTVKKYDATKYSGYRSVIQKGVKGSERVTKTQIYIDGIPSKPEYDYTTVKEPIDEIIMIGSRTSFGGVYIGEASDKGFLWPAPSCHRVSSPYGWRSSGWHNGIDLVKAGGGALGTPVIASRSGRVEVIQRSNTGYGNMVLINHGDGYKTRYAHMIKGSITVSVGEYVEAGQTIGKVGSTGNSSGPHLHFEVIVNGETYNPKNYIY